MTAPADGLHSSHAVRQRVLAVLYRNDGQITSETGVSVSVLANFMAKHVAHQTVRAAINDLEAQGKVLRDTRIKGVPIENLPNRTGRFKGLNGARTYGIYMVDVDKDKPEQWALDELEAAIKERTLAKVAKRSSEKAKEAKRESTKAKVEALAPKTVDEAIAPVSDDPAERVAATLLAKVLGILQDPPVREVHVETESISDAEMKKIKRLLAEANEGITARDRNIEVLTERLIEADRTIAALKGAVKSGSGLTHALKDALGEKDWASLMQPDTPAHATAKHATTGHARKV